MTASVPATKDRDKLIRMSDEEIESFLEKYKEWIVLIVKNEIAGHLREIESFRKKISGFRKEWEEVESSVFLPEIKNRQKARIDQNILIEQEEIRRIAMRIRKLDKCRREFVSFKFLRPMLLGLLKKNFYRFEFASMDGDVALTGWTNFVEIESARHNFAAQVIAPAVFLLGHYKIEIVLVRRGFQLPIKIYNLDSLSSATTFPHPHVNESFEPCFGDFAIPIQNCIEEKRFLHAFHLLHIFISSYSWNNPQGFQQNERRPYERAKIEYWPEKGSAESPKKPPGEGTGAYGG